MPRIAGHRYVMFKIHCFGNAAYAPLYFNTYACDHKRYVCAQSLLVASRTGRATRSDDIEVPFIGNNICYARASPHSTGTACTRLLSPVRSVVYVSFCPAVWVIGPELR